MCTNFQINAKDGAFIVGRTMEFGMDLQSEFYIHRRGDILDLSTLAAKGFGELNNFTGWKGRYGYVGVSSFHLPAVVDGINEAGLTVGALWLPGTTYQKMTNPSHAIPAPFLCDWVLANCATVEDVINQLPEHEFWLPEILTKQLPLHFPIVDAKGNSIVIEFQDGKQNIHQNPVGVCTNAPWFPWHLANLSNYINLSPNDPASITLGKLKIDATGHGTGLAGLPGNATPPSRFVRTTYLKQFAEEPMNAAESYVLATHLLNTVDIPKGTVRDGKEKDYTQWAAIKDLTNGVFAVRTYDSMVYRSLNIKKIDFSNIKSHSFPIPAMSDISFITPQQMTTPA